MLACITCNRDTLIKCDDCAAPTCWDHRHDYGTHHDQAYQINTDVLFNGQRFHIVEAYPDLKRWRYDGHFYRPDGGLRFQRAVGVWESDLTQPLG